MMDEKTILIIGAGAAGLSAGCYARMNGYRARVFELHGLPGGLCTAWERKGYTFDGCIHYLFGSGEGRPFHRMWQELGAVQDRRFIHHDEYQRVTDGRQTLVVHTDPDRLERGMLELSPADAKPIRAFMRGVRQFAGFDLTALYEKPRALFTALDWRDFGSRMMPFMGPMAQWALVSMRDFARRFKDPFLRRAVPQMFSWDEAPVMMGMMLLAYMQAGNAGFPAGASLEFARALEKRFLDLGGEITYRSQVEKILVEDGKAVGIRLYNDEIHRADYLVSAADGHATIFDMLDGQFVSRKIRRMYDGHLPIHQMVQVSLGVKRDLSNEPHWVTYLLDEPALIAGEERGEIGVKHYCFDPSLAPAGRSVVEFMVRTHYAYWQRIYGRSLYDSEQTQVSDVLLDLVERWYPGLRRDVEYRDEATPLSYERYTGNWLGATCGWLLSKQTVPLMVLGVPKALPGLRNFWMAGHWVEPGGTVTLAAASGRNAIQLICAQEGKIFRAALP
jgi:phytoene dehydrogenase-like protein